jgi:hypothetical protein
MVAILDRAHSTPISMRDGYMDRITEGLLGEFTTEFVLSDLPQDKQFETFATYIAVRKHYSDSTFIPSTLVTGDGNDTVSMESPR